MTVNLQETVGHLATAIPGATRIFEQYGIDYCCGGKRTLAEACHHASAVVTEVLQSLDKIETERSTAGPVQDWSTESLTTLAAYLVDTHHFFTKEELVRIEKLIAKVWAAHGNRHPELFKVLELFQQLKQDLLPHMLKEEQVLFPYVARLEEAQEFGLPVPQPFFGTVNHPVRMMMLEHDTAGALLRQLRQATQNYEAPADGCASYRALYQALREFEADLHQHIHLENNVLFPRAVALEEKAAPERAQTNNGFHCLGQAGVI